jgi:hypothetical protein
MGQDTKEVECIDVIRIGLEDLLVDRLRLLQPTGLVVPQGRRQGFVVVGHGAIIATRLWPAKGLVSWVRG